MSILEFTSDDLDGVAIHSQRTGISPFALLHDADHFYRYATSNDWRMLYALADARDVWAMEYLREVSECHYAHKRYALDTGHHILVPPAGLVSYWQGQHRSERSRIRHETNY